MMSIIRELAAMYLSPDATSAKCRDLDDQGFLGLQAVVQTGEYLLLEMRPTADQHLCARTFLELALVVDLLIHRGVPVRINVVIYPDDAIATGAKSECDLLFAMANLDG